MWPPIIRKGSPLKRRWKKKGAGKYIYIYKSHSTGNDARLFSNLFQAPAEGFLYMLGSIIFFCNMGELVNPNGAKKGRWVD